MNNNNKINNLPGFETQRTRVKPSRYCCWVLSGCAATVDEVYK